MKGVKERIMEAAVELFYKKGFSATGVREIAKIANVSTSMINYHFGSKMGILKEIMEILFDKLNNEFKLTNLDGKPLDERIRIAIKSLVKSIKNNEKMFRIMLMQIPDEESDLIEYRASKVREIIYSVFKNHFKGFGDEKRFEILGPALSGMIFSHFILKDIIPQVSGIEYPEDFYDTYADYIADLYLYGALRIINKN